MVQQRPRPAPPAAHEDFVPAPVESLSLEALRNAVASPGVVRAEVDALFGGLARPPAGEESPRARADFLHSLLELPESVLGTVGGDGRTVRAAAVEALLALGYPYALEVTPEMLSLAREEQPGRPYYSRPSAPTAGIITGTLGALVQLALPSIATYLLGEHRHSFRGEDFLLLVLLYLVPAAGPLVMSLLGKTRDMPRLLSWGNGLMVLQALFWLGWALLAWTANVELGLLASLILPWHLQFLTAYLFNKDSDAPVARPAPPKALEPPEPDAP